MSISTKKNYAAQFRMALAPILLAGMWIGPSALAQTSQQDCSAIADPMQRAQCLCFKGQNNYQNQTSGVVGNAMQNDPYLQQVENRVPGNPNSYASPGSPNAVSQSCSGLVKGAFDSVMTSASGLLGFDVNSLFGGVANQYGGSLCQEVNNAISSRTGIACPRVSIPGFPINCNVNLGVNSNGVQIGGSGNLGGWSTNGGAQSGVNGVYNAGGSVNAGTTARGSASSRGNVGTVVNQAAPQVNSTLGTISNNVQCWFGGGTGC